MGRPRHPAARGAACFALLVALSQVGGSTGVALGPVIAVTPDEVAPSFPITSVYHPSISSRGEVVGAADLDFGDGFLGGSAAWALLDVGGQEPMFDTKGIAVSGDRCSAVTVTPAGNTDLIELRNRCTGAITPLAETSRFYDPINKVALSFDGRFAVVMFADMFVGSEFPTDRLARIDTQTGEQLTFPLPPGYFGWVPSLGLDISDDGNIVVVPVIGSTTAVGVYQDAAAWNVATGQVVLVSNQTGVPGGISAFPSVSGDGRFVSFASSRNVPAVRARGPWVFVTPSGGGPPTRVSGVADGSYYSALNVDATQVAFGVGASSGCALNMTDLFTLEGQCPTGRIDVAFGPTPGLTSGVSVEPISLNLAGVANTGIPHIEPDISRNGRWVTWVAFEGYDMVATGDPGRFKGIRHAFVRRREPGLTISPNPVDFGTIAASTTSPPLTATVTNTGRTSVFLDSISVSGSNRFSPVGGGSCAKGASLPPGASCTVNVQFAAPGNATTVTASLFVGETEFDPIGATTQLIGRSSVTPTTTTTAPPPGVTTTTTSPPPGVTTTTTTTIVGQVSPTTVPGSVLLNADPTEIDYGPVAVGFAAPFRTITVTNGGTASGVILTTMEGANPDDFFVSDNQCSGAALAPGASCVITVTMVALAGGPRSASLTVTSGGSGGDVSLRGEGRFEPRLMTSPGAVTTQGITTFVGLGFPAGVPVSVKVLATGFTFDATPDEFGRFQVLFPLNGRLTLGNYVLQVDGVPSTYEAARGQLVVVLPTFEPQGPTGPAFGNSTLITRGG